MHNNAENQNTFGEEQNRQGKIYTAISRILDASVIKHLGDRASTVLAITEKLQNTCNLRLTDRGWLVLEDHSGKPMDLQRTVEDALMADSNLVDSASVVQAIREGTIDIGCKEDLRTTQEKVAFISKFSLDTFTNLPPKRTPKVELSKEMNAAEYHSLSLSQKVQLTNLITEQELGAILRRK